MGVSGWRTLEMLESEGVLAPGGFVGVDLDRERVEIPFDFCQAACPLDNSLSLSLVVGTRRRRRLLAGAGPAAYRPL